MATEVLMDWQNQKKKWIGLGLGETGRRKPRRVLKQNGEKNGCWLSKINRNILVVIFNSMCAC
jgi:hypothetical protein